MDTASNVQRERIAYGSIAAAGVQTFVYGPIELDGALERIRVVCAESGVVGTPGVCGIIAVFA